MKFNKTAMLVGAMLLSGSALAAGNSNFAGPYAGVNLGAAQGTATITEYNYSVWDYGEYSLTSGLKASYGLQVGYNMAVGTGGLVGVELSYDRPTLSVKRAMEPGTNPMTMKADWKGDLGLRFKGGLVSDKTLFYALAGFVQQKVDYAYGYPNTPGSYYTKDASSVGLSYGLGVESAVADNISVRGQVVVNDTKSQDTTFNNEPVDLHSSSTTFSVGVNYRF